MILPGRIFYQNGKWPGFSKAPMTWLLSGLCVLFFMASFFYESADSNDVFANINQNEIQKVQILYAEINPLKTNSNKARNPSSIDSIENVSNSVQTHSFQSRDLRAFRDPLFWQQMQNRPFQVGDPVEISELKAKFLEARRLYESSIAYEFGLGGEATTPFAWITYQFVHTSALHLLMNLVFLIFICAQLERRVPTGWIVAVYLLSGIGAGVLYLVSAGNYALAMLGASGSISGLMAFTAVALFDRSLKWSYMIVPFEKGYGTIQLPAYLLFPIYLVADFTRLISSPEGLDSVVAHSAHVGGALTGLALGFFFLFDQKLKSFLIQKWGPVLSKKELDMLRGN